MAEVDLTIKATAETAEAKAAVADLNAEVAKTSGAVASSSEAYERARAAMANFVAEAIEGGKGAKEALETARVATDELEASITKAKAAGSPVDPNAIAMLGTYRGTLESAAKSFGEVEKEGKKAKGAVDELSDATKKGTKPTEEAGKEYKNLAANIALARGNVGGFSGAARTLGAAATTAATGVTFLGRALAIMAGPIGLAVAALIFLATQLGRIKELLTGAADAMGKWIAGVGQGKPVLDEHGKAIDELDPKYKKAADAVDTLTRAQAAMKAGVIPLTADVALMTAEYIVHQAALHGVTTATDELKAAAKLLGVGLPKDFELMKASVKGFADLYNSELKKGPEAARIYAEDNKKAVDALASDYQRLGREVPAELRKIMAAYGDLTTAFEDALVKNEEQTKKYTETISDLVTKSATLSKELETSGKAFVDHAAKIEASRKTAIEAIDKSTKATIASLQEEVKATEAAHASRSISDAEYFRKINQLFADQAKAKRDAYEQERKVDAEKAKELADDTVKYVEDTRKRKEALSDASIAEEAARKKLEELNRERQTELKALIDVRPLLFQAGLDTKALADVHLRLADGTLATARNTTDLANQFDLARSQAVAMGGPLDALIGKYGQLRSAAIAAAAAVASVTSGAGLAGGAPPAAGTGETTGGGGGGGF